MAALGQNNFYAHVGDNTGGFEFTYSNPAKGCITPAVQSITLTVADSCVIPIAVWEPHNRWTRMMVEIYEDWDNIQGIKTMVYPTVTFQEEQVRWNEDSIWFETTTGTSSNALSNSTSGSDSPICLAHPASH